MKIIHPGHLEHRFCMFGCQILLIADLAIMPHHYHVAHNLLVVFQCKYLGLVVCFGLKDESLPLKKTTSYHSMHCSEAGSEAPMSVSSDVTLRVADLHL